VESRGSRGVSFGSRVGFRKWEELGLNVGCRLGKTFEGSILRVIEVLGRVKAVIAMLNALRSTFEVAGISSGG
jgi:hypothetical protein